MAKATMKTLDQQRAAFAWKETERALSNGCVPDDHVKLAKGAPALIMASGLMQTLAFYKSKGKDHHRWLGGAIIGWLRESGILPPEAQKFADTMPKLHSADADTYLRATEETLEFLRWLRQVADARKKKEA